jgi:hypothetical protein
MKLLTLILCLCWNLSYGSDTCTNALIDKAFKPNFNANYFLIIPVETSKVKRARLFILKENLRKYMIVLDSAYADNEKLKDYLKKVLSGREKMYFYESVYKQEFNSDEYEILKERNTIDINTPKKSTTFLKKYLLHYSEKMNYLNLNLSIPIKNYYFVYERLFALRYLVASGDGVIAVFKVDCK